MENYSNYSEEPQKSIRPTFLKVLCILTFISAGYSQLSTVLQLMVGPASKEQLTQQKVVLAKSIDQFKDLEADWMVAFIQKMIKMTEAMNFHFYLFNLLSLLFLTIGIVGAIKMWTGHRIGFHLYIVYSLLATSHLYFVMSPQDVPSVYVIFNLIVSGIFVFMYSRNLHWMK
jgi:hypothetical protein